MAQFYPTEMRQAGPDLLGITWNDGHRSVLAVRAIRLSCRCANCVEEMSGRPMLDPATVPADVQPTVINPVGRYAIHITWSDGHTSGIYTYDHLRSLCTCATCASQRA